MVEADVKGIADVVSKVGVPVFLCVVFSGLMIWLIYYQTTSMEAVIQKNTESNTQITMAVKSLEQSNVQMGSSFKLLETEVKMRMPK